MSRYIPKADRDHVMARDGYTCRICGRDAWNAVDIDHIYQYGWNPQLTWLHEPFNLRVACPSCNRGRPRTKFSLGRDMGHLCDNLMETDCYLDYMRRGYRMDMLLAIRFELERDGLFKGQAVLLWFHAQAKILKLEGPL